MTFDEAIAATKTGRSVRPVGVSDFWLGPIEPNDPGFLLVFSDGSSVRQADVHVGSLLARESVTGEWELVVQKGEETKRAGPSRRNRP